MTTTAKLVTAEELLAMSESKWLELYDGELRSVSPADARHGEIAVQSVVLLNSYIRPRKLGRVLVEGGFVLRRNPDAVLGPDVSFVAQSRIPAAGLPAKFVEGFPDLAVEIISPTNPRRAIQGKMERYLKAGTPLGWLVDSVGETVDVCRPGADVETLGRNDAIAGENVVPGFSCGVAEFFA